MGLNNTPSPLSGFHVTCLDEKGRCAFPSKLRDNAVDKPVYIFFSAHCQRFFATLDREHLQEKFPQEFGCLPLQETHLDKQGKIYLGWKLFQNHGIEGLKKGSKISFIPTLGDNKIIEIHISNATIEASIELRKSIADSVTSKLLTPGGGQPHFSANIIDTSSYFSLDISQRGIAASTFTVNF